MEVEPRTRIFGAVPKVPDTFCTETPATRPSREREMSAHLYGGSGEQAAVHLGHTRDDGRFQHVGVLLQDHADEVLYGDFGVGIAHEADNQVFGVCGDLGEIEIAIQIGEGAYVGGPFNRYECSNHGNAGFVDDVTLHRPRLSEGCRAPQCKEQSSQ